MKLMDRIETLEYLNNKYLNGERLVVTRYNDGEYLLMNNLKGHLTQTSTELISVLLKEAIKIKGQLVCINYLKPHNIEKEDIWFKTRNYLIEEGGHELYGCGNWSVYDFSNNNILLSKLFKGKVLIVTGLYNESKSFFKDFDLNIDFYETKKRDVEEDYNKIKRELFNICIDYNTILFSCGPVGKVLIPNLINKCNSNLIDFGAMLNAILDLSNQWPMSWSKEINLEEKRKNFLEKLKQKNSEM